jgi:hypothetical protein
MTLPRIRVSAVLATATRLCFLLAVLSVPVLAMPAKDLGDNFIVGEEVKRSSGAGLVIVVGLQRAR